MAREAGLARWGTVTTPDTVVCPPGDRRVHDPLWVSHDALRSGSARVRFLDACRAVAVLAMLFANMMNVFLHRVPELLGHNEGDVLRALDFPAAVFQFLIGVSLVLFLERRGAAGRGRTLARLTALRRFVLLIALGLLLDGIGTLRMAPQWGVLQTLGLGGAFATLLSDRSDGVVAAVALALLALFSGSFNGDVHHDPIAAIAFVPLTLAGLLVGRGLLPGVAPQHLFRRATAVALVGFAVAAATYAAGVPFNKVLGTSSFVAVAAAMSSLLLASTASWERAGLVYPPWLVAVGANALTAWVLMYVLVYYPAWLAFPEWERLPLLPGMAATVTALGALATMAVALGRRGIRIPI
jgi:heparan-alpha-glucosaminide N-acetyltransferase-like protein